MTLFTTGSGVAQPWQPYGDVPLPAWAQSVRLHESDVAFFQRPDAASARRGSGSAEAVLPIFGRARGPGCPRRWVLIGPSAWVCDRDVSYSPAAAAGAASNVASAVLPLRYYFVGTEGTLGYSTLEGADDSAPAKEFEPGFSIGALSEAQERGEDYVLTSEELWVPRRDLVPAQPSNFRGALLTQDVHVGWVWTDRAPVHATPGGARRGTVSRLERITLHEQLRRAGTHWWRIAENSWIRGRDVRAVTSAPMPDGLRPNERWIDVDSAQQILTAYEGSVPIYATLISTGRGRDGSAEATPKGVHRIWAKLVTSNMDNLEDEEARRYYSMQAVPWVMFFKAGFGLHGTYWHSSFGRARSHGCVNLSPADAAWLFHWTSPHLPAGWSAVHPTNYELGTLIRVR